MPDEIAPSVGDGPTLTPPASVGDGPTLTGAAVPTADETRAFVPLAPPGFVLEGELGRGGMGVVYRARQLGLNRPVALKMILGERIEQRHIIRFLAEAEAVASVKHPNVVEVYQFGEDKGRPYLAMEFCPGGSLPTDACDPSLAAETILAVADGVAAAHAAGIVHRDLKPGNVLLAADDTPKVTDFGLAKRAASSGELTKTNAVMGTPAYMSPEQAQGGTKFVGPQADVWSLGVMLYEQLTGERPFTGDDAWQVLAAVMKADVPSLRKAVTGVPRDLELICLKCLEKDPADRYPTAKELADDLRRFLAGDTVSVRAAGTVERGRKWARRNPALAVALVVTVAALVLGTTVSVWQASRAREEARRADAAAKAARDRANDLADALKTADYLRENAVREEKGIRAGMELVLTAFRVSTDPGGKSIRVDEFLGVLQKAAHDSRSGDLFVRQMLMNFVGTIMTAFGRNRDAIPLLAESLELRRKSQGADYHGTVSEQCNLGFVYIKLSEWDKALPILLEGLEGLERLPDPPDPRLVQNLKKAGGMARHAGQIAFARRVQEATLRLLLAKLGPDHPDTLGTMTDLARTHLDAGTPKLALPLYEAALPLQVKKFGAEQEVPVVTLCNLCACYSRLGMHDRVIETGERGLPLLRSVYGPDYSGAFRVGMYLAAAYAATGRFDDALPLCLQAAAAHEKEAFADPRAAGDVILLADILARQRSAAEGETWLRKITPAVKKKSGADSPDSAALLAALGRCLSRQKKWADAETVLRECLAVCEKLPDGKAVPAWQTADVRSTLGGVLVELGMLPEAGKLLASAHAELRKAVDQIPPELRRERLTESLDRLVRLARESGDPVAEKWMAEYATLPPALPFPASPPPPFPK